MRMKGILRVEKKDSEDRWGLEQVRLVKGEQLDLRLIGSMLLNLLESRL